MANHTLQFVTCMHGDERMPALALAAIGLPQLIANPQAVALGVRYVESDLNASFGKPCVDLETRRAAEILSLLPQGTTVVDFHSYETDSGPFSIIVEADMLPLALQAGIRRIVLMKYNIKKGHALINHRPGISIEVGNHHDPQSFAVAIEVAKRLTGANTIPLLQREAELYEVYGEIHEAGEYENFTLHQNGFYPLFSPINSYGTYGLKARRVTSF